jgi:hypothetical protein
MALINNRESGKNSTDGRGSSPYYSQNVSYSRFDMKTINGNDIVVNGFEDLLPNAVGGEFTGKSQTGVHVK